MGDGHPLSHLLVTFQCFNFSTAKNSVQCLALLCVELLETLSTAGRDSSRISPLHPLGLHGPTTGALLGNEEFSILKDRQMSLLDGDMCMQNPCKVAPAFREEEKASS